MEKKYKSPSVGLNAGTGRVVEDWRHVMQSLQDIFTTRFGQRVMREWYGSFVPNLLGRIITPNEVTPWFAAVTSAIEQWEPRYRITQIQVTRVTRDGHLHFYMDGEYRPRATFGDFTVEGARRVNAYTNPDGILVEQREQAE